MIRLVAWLCEKSGDRNQAKEFAAERCRKPPGGYNARTSLRIIAGDVIGYSARPILAAILRDSRKNRERS